MSGYLEDLWDLQHAIHGTEPDVEQHNHLNESIDRAERRRAREIRKLAARHEIERWNERDKGPSVPERGPQPDDNGRAHPDNSEGQEGASSAPGDSQNQDPCLLPSWARKMLAVANQIELENDDLKKHKIHRGRLDKDGQGHQQYLATQQHLRDFQKGSHRKTPKDSRPTMRHGSAADPQAFLEQQIKPFEEVESPVSSTGSIATVVPRAQEQGSDEEDGAADKMREVTRRGSKGKAKRGNIKRQKALTSNGVEATTSIHGVAEHEVMQESEIDQPKPNEARHQEVVAQASPAEREELPPKVGQDKAQNQKLERKQKQKAATEARRKRRQGKKQEAKRQKTIEEQRAEEERKKDDENFWQWLRERQLANPEATVTSLSKEQYIKEARQKKERDAKEARRKQREERAAASQNID